jgi:ABC-type uncharacterized transport system permease subunit
VEIAGPRLVGVLAVVIGAAVVAAVIAYPGGALAESWLIDPLTAIAAAGGGSVVGALKLAIRAYRDKRRTNVIV